MRVNSLSLFVTGIEPQWEDEVNSQGGEFRIDVESRLPLLQEVWEKLVFSVITDNFMHSDMLSGIRLLDKSTDRRKNMFRIEIWTKFDNSQVSLVNEMKAHLQAEYVETFQGDANTKMIKADWIEFMNHRTAGAPPAKTASQAQQ